MNSKQVACGLGWFGIGLGLVELFAPNAVGRAVGLGGRAGFIRLFGLREIASGVVILAAEEPDARLWIRGWETVLMARYSPVVWARTTHCASARSWARSLWRPSSCSIFCMR